MATFSSFGCIECMRCRLLLPMCVVFVSTVTRFNSASPCGGHSVQPLLNQFGLLFFNTFSSTLAQISGECFVPQFKMVNEELMKLVFCIAAYPRFQVDNDDYVRRVLKTEETTTKPPPSKSEARPESSSRSKVSRGSVSFGNCNDWRVARLKAAVVLFHWLSLVAGRCD